MQWPRRILIPLGLWLVALSVLPISLLLAVHHLRPGATLSGAALTHRLVIGGAALATTPILGFQLGRHGRWLQTLVVAGLGTALLMLAYVGLFLSADDSGTTDNAAGAGLAIFAPPTFLVLAVLLAAGAGPAHLMGRLRRHG